MFVYLAIKGLNKRFEHAAKLKSTLHENPKRFWKYIKSMTKLNTSPIFLQDGQTIITKPSIKANMLNNVFQSVFSSAHVLNTSPKSPNRLTEIQLTTSQAYEILSKLDSSKASGHDNLPGRIFKAVAWVSVERQ